MKDWKTTAIGIGTAIITGAVPILQSGNISWVSLVQGIGVALLGYFAADSKKV